MKSLGSTIEGITSRTYSAYKEAIWRRKVASGQPVEFPLPSGGTILLYTGGQIAELLFTHSFVDAAVTAETSSATLVRDPGLWAARSSDLLPN
jgi:hypothetical protein